MFSTIFNNKSYDGEDLGEAGFKSGRIRVWQDLFWAEFNSGTIYVTQDLCHASFEWA